MSDPTPTWRLVPVEIASIIEHLHTQDNRITDNPLFAVQQKRRVYGLDEDYEDAHGWAHPDRDNLVLEGEPEYAELKAAWESGEEPRGDWRRVGFKDTWEFVTGCLTEQGCKDYIRVNGHNLHEPRIYAYGSYRNAEFIALRKWLMSLRSPSPQALPPITLPEPVAFRVEFGTVGLPPEHPSRITGVSFYETEAEAHVAVDEMDFSNITEPLFTAVQVLAAIAADRRAGGR